MRGTVNDSIAPGTGASYGRPEGILSESHPVEAEDIPGLELCDTYDLNLEATSFSHVSYLKRAVGSGIDVEPEISVERADRVQIAQVPCRQETKSTGFKFLS